MRAQPGRGFPIARTPDAPSRSLSTHTATIASDMVGDEFVHGREAVLARQDRRTGHDGDRTMKCQRVTEGALQARRTSGVSRARKHMLRATPRCEAVLLFTIGLRSRRGCGDELS
jgi:hypothetical protein